MCGHGTTFLGQGSKHRETLPWMKSAGLHQSLKFGVLKLGLVSEIKRLRHEQGECRVQMEIRKKNTVIDWFSVRSQQKVEGTNF